MGDISDNFSRREFQCKCNCGYNSVDVELLEVLEEIRTYFGRPITINSGDRCYKHNEYVKHAADNSYKPGTSKSKHMYGIAADIVVVGISPQKVYNYLNNKYPDKYGLGNAKSFTHIDVRHNRARWAY